MKEVGYKAPTEFGKLAETISKRFAPIIRMWRFTKNNGITEGFHRKMKLIQRRAYGYRNFKNYPLESTCRMRGETMKGKSKKSTYSTIFGVDPINRFVFEIIAVFPPPWIGRIRFAFM